MQRTSNGGRSGSDPACARLRLTPPPPTTHPGSDPHNCSIYTAVTTRGRRSYEGFSSELELMMWRRSRFATAFVETGEATWMLTT